MIKQVKQILTDPKDRDEAFVQANNIKARQGNEPYDRVQNDRVLNEREPHIGNEPPNRVINDREQNIGIQQSNASVEDYNDVDVRDRIPADISKAEEHAKATRIAKPIQQDLTRLCECCGIQVENEHLSFFHKTLDLSFLGPSVSLYFSFVKGCAFLLLLTAVTYTIYGMILNKLGNYCGVPADGQSLAPDACYKNVQNEYSLINRRDDNDSIYHQNIVNLGVVIILIISIHLMRRQVRMQEEYLDYKLISPSDFTVQLTNLPLKYNEDDVRKLLQDWWDNLSEKKKQKAGAGDLEIEKICIAYDVKEYMKKMDERDKLNLKLLKNDYYERMNNKYPFGQNKADLISKRQKAQQELDEIEAEVLSGKYDKLTDDCFVTFNRREVLDALLDAYSLSRLEKVMLRIKKLFGVKKYKVLSIEYEGETYIINVFRAPEPSDVKWENCGATRTQKFFSRLLTTVCTVLLLGACFVSIFFIKQWQTDIKSNNSETSSDILVRARLYLLSLFASLLIVLINLALKLAITFLSNQEHQRTFAQFKSAVASKLAIAQFCNTALLTLIANYSTDVDGLWSSGGITSDITLIVILNSFIPVIFNYFNPSYLIRICKRRKIRNDKNGKYSQGEANKQFQGPEFKIETKYSSVIKTLWMIGFYTPLSPYLPLFGLITLFLSYWMDKYLLYNRFSRPIILGSDLNEEMIDWIEFFPVIIAVGNLFWMQRLGVNDAASLPLMIIAVVLSFISFILPSDHINKMIFKIKELDDIKKTGTYQSKKYQFQEDYDRCNPVTKEEATRVFLQELQQIDPHAANEYLKRWKKQHKINKKQLKNLKHLQPSLMTSATSAIGKLAQLPKKIFQNQSPNNHQNYQDTHSRISVSQFDKQHSPQGQNNEIELGNQKVINPNRNPNHAYDSEMNRMNNNNKNHNSQSIYPEQNYIQRSAYQNNHDNIRH